MLLLPFTLVDSWSGKSGQFAITTTGPPRFAPFGPRSARPRLDLCASIGSIPVSPEVFDAGPLLVCAQKFRPPNTNTDFLHGPSSPASFADLASHLFLSVSGLHGVDTSYYQKMYQFEDTRIPVASKRFGK